MLFLNWLLGLSTWRLRVFTFALSMSVRIALMLSLHIHHRVERVEHTNIAISLAQGRGFANAYGDHSGPTAHSAPLHVLLLSVAFRIFGDGREGNVAQHLIGYTFTSAAYALLPSIAEIFGLSALTGILGGVISALLPINVYPQYGANSTVCVPLLIILILIYSNYVWQTESFDLKSALQGGLLVGIALLTDPIVMALIASLALAALVATRFANKTYWIGLIATTCLILAPWTVRNYRVLGSPILTRSNLGMELWLSNIDGIHPTSEENFAPGGPSLRLHSYDDEAQLQNVETLGEVAYNRSRMQLAKTWIANHPKAFLWLTIRRFARFWFPIMFRPIQMILTGIITLLGLGGFLLWFRKKPAMWPLPLILFAVYPLPYYVTQTSSRYRFPLELFILLFACSFVVNILRRGRGFYAFDREVAQCADVYQLQDHG